MVVASKLCLYIKTETTVKTMNSPDYVYLVVIASLWDVILLALWLPCVWESNAILFHNQAMLPLCLEFLDIFVVWKNLRISPWFHDDRLGYTPADHQAFMHGSLSHLLMSMNFSPTSRQIILDWLVTISISYFTSQLWVMFHIQPCFNWWI